MRALVIFEVNWPNSPRRFERPVGVVLPPVDLGQREPPRVRVSDRASAGTRSMTDRHLLQASDHASRVGWNETFDYMAESGLSGYSMGYAVLEVPDSATVEDVYRHYVQEQRTETFPAAA